MNDYTPNKVAILIEMEDEKKAKEWLERLSNNPSVDAVSMQKYDESYGGPVIYFP